MDFGAQAHHLVDVHEAVFKNRFSDRTGAPGNSVKRHELRLHVCGESRVLGGAKRLRLQTACRLHPDEAIARRDDSTGFAQLVNHRVQMVSARMLEHHIAACRSHRTQKSTRLDAVGHHLVVATVQTFHALNADTATAVAFDLRAHFDEHLGQVTNFRLLRSVFQNGFTFGQRGGHQEIFSACDSHHVSGDVTTFETRASWQ